MHHNDTLQIAKTMLQVQKLRESSYVAPNTDKHGRPMSDGHYAMDWDEAIAKTENKLGIHFRPMLRLMASSRFCDFQEWALQVVYKLEPTSDLIPKGWTPFPDYFDM